MLTVNEFLQEDGNESEEELLLPDPDLESDYLFGNGLLKDSNQKVSETIVPPLPVPLAGDISELAKNIIPVNLSPAKSLVIKKREVAPNI
jgi:hypothetical protein